MARKDEGTERRGAARGFIEMKKKSKKKNTMMIHRAGAGDGMKKKSMRKKRKMVHRAGAGDEMKKKSKKKNAKMVYRA